MRLSRIEEQAKQQEELQEFEVWLHVCMQAQQAAS